MPPRLGFWTGCAWCVWLVVYGLLWVTTDRPTLASEPAFERLVQVGLIYGLVSQAVWMTGALERPWVRWCAGSTLVIIGAGLLSVQEAEAGHVARFREELAHLGGMAIAQSVVFFILGIGRWSGPGSSAPRRPRQFATLDIALLTVATALVLALAGKQLTPVAAADYWEVMLGVWIGMPVIAATAAIAGSASRPLGRAVALVLAVALTALAVFALVAMEVRAGRFDAALAALLAKMYGALLVAFLVCCLVMPQAGRLDRRREGPPRH